jgi:hypothetical protein
MTVTAVDLKQFTDKKVTLTRNLDKPNDKGETAEELEGTVMAVAGSGVMFKPKGKTSATIIDLDDIEKIDYLETSSKKLTRKTLKVVTFGQARTHVLERHGLTLGQVNAMSEKDAFDWHAAIDHEAADLGHVHGDKPAPEAEGETESDADED